MPSVEQQQQQQPTDRKDTDNEASAVKPAGGADAEGPMDSYKRLEAAVANVALPDAQKAIVVRLKEQQEAHLRLEEQYRAEWNELKLKYFSKFQPLYVARKDMLVHGFVLADDIPAATTEEVEEAAKTTGTKRLPMFWVNAMRNHVLLAEMIEPHDIPILGFLEDIVFDWCDPKEQTSFKLHFHFAPNKHFENKVLTKTYYLERGEEDEAESVLTRTEGTEITWKENSNITQKMISRKQRNKRTNQTRTIVEVVEDNSFFNFFQSHEIPSEQQLQTMSEREVTELEMIIEAEFEVGCILRDKIIPRALGWYLGIEKDDDAASEDDSDLEDDFDDEEADDDEEEDDDEEDDEDDDEEPPKAGKRDHRRHKGKH